MVPSQQAIEVAALKRLGIPLWRKPIQAPDAPAVNLQKLLKAALRAEKLLASRGLNSTKRERDRWKRTLVKAYRAAPPPAEAAVLPWMLAQGFVHQFLLHGYIADFAHRDHRLVVELDGGSHRGREGYDGHRDRVLAENGWRTVRFPNAAALDDAPALYKAVLRLLR